MRKPLIARLVLALALLLSGALAFAAQAAPPAQEAEQGAAPARIAVVHAAPFAATLDGTTVTVVATVLGQDILITNSFKFGDAVPYITVPAATYNVKVYAGTLTLPIPSGTSPVYQETVSLAAGTDYTVAAVGTNTTTYPIDLLILDDTTAAPGSASAKLRVVHAAPFGPTVAATAVSVIPDGDTTETNNLIPPADRPFTYGKATAFLTVPAGVELNYKVVPAGSPTVTAIDLPPLVLNTGDLLTVIAVGDGVNRPLSVVALPFVKRAPAQLRLVHAAPFATGSATVTVRLNGQVVTNNFNFRDITPYTTLPAGIYTVEVFAGTAATGTPALAGPIVLFDGLNYTAVAMGTGVSPYPLQLRQLVDNPTPAGSATARLRVLHAAPFAPTVPGTAVDVRLQNGAEVSPTLNAIVYDDLRDNVIVPSGTALDLKVVPAGQPNAAPIIDPTALTFGAGDAFTIIAIGGANGQSAGLLLLDDQSVTTRLFMPLIAKR